MKKIFLLIALAATLNAQNGPYIPGQRVIEKGVNVLGTETGATNALVAATTTSPHLQSYQAGATYTVLTAHACTGACTINIDGLGVKSIKLGSGSNPGASDIPVGMELHLTYDGTNMQMVNQSAASAAGSGTVLSVDGSANGGVETIQGGAGAAITTSGTVRGISVQNAQTGTTYTYLTGDRFKTVIRSNAAAMTDTLPQATSGVGTNFPSGWCMYVENQGGSLDTITPTTSTINGAASLIIGPNQGAMICSNATNYNAVLYGQAPPLTAAGSGFSSPFNLSAFTNSNNIAATNNVVWQFVADKTMTVATINVINKFNLAGGFIAFAIYSDDLSGSANGTCSTLLGQTTPVSTAVASGTAFQASMATPVTLKNGVVYWFAVTSDTSSAQIEVSNDTLALTRFNQTNHPRIGRGNASTGTGAALAFPASCGTLNLGTNWAVANPIFWP